MCRLSEGPGEDPHPLLVPSFLVPSAPPQNKPHTETQRGLSLLRPHCRRLPLSVCLPTLPPPTGPNHPGFTADTAGRGQTKFTVLFWSLLYGQNKTM